MDTTPVLVLLYMYMIFGFCYKKKKKKKQVNSPSIWSRTPNSVRIRQSGRTGNQGVTKAYTEEEEETVQETQLGEVQEQEELKLEESLSR